VGRIWGKGKKKKGRCRSLGGIFFIAEKPCFSKKKKKRLVEKNDERGGRDLLFRGGKKGKGIN